MNIQQPPKNPTLAAILSLLIPGLGQIYNGETAKGIIIIVVEYVGVTVLAILTGGIGFVIWPVVWIWAIYDAYKVAKRINEEAAQQREAKTKVCPKCTERVDTDAQVCVFCSYQFMPVPV